MSDVRMPEESQPARPGWWKRRSKKSKFFLIALALIVTLVAVGAATGGSSDKGASDANVTSPTAPDAGAPALKAAPIVRGAWKGDCNQFSAGDLSACRAVTVRKVTCQWRDDDVHMTVVFKNTFGAHVTMHMDPTYILLNAGLHGNGLTSVKDVGLDPGELRTVTVDENPAGVDNHPTITACRPGVDVLEGVELG